jgi:hypothetical protein
MRAALAPPLLVAAHDPQLSRRAIQSCGALQFLRGKTGKAYPVGTGVGIALTPPCDAYPIDKAQEIVDLTGSPLDADRGSRCRAEIQPTCCAAALAWHEGSVWHDPLTRPLRPTLPGVDGARYGLRGGTMPPALLLAGDGLALAEAHRRSKQPDGRTAAEAFGTALNEEALGHCGPARRRLLCRLRPRPRAGGRSTPARTDRIGSDGRGVGEAVAGRQGTRARQIPVRMVGYATAFDWRCASRSKASRQDKP